MTDARVTGEVVQDNHRVSIETGIGVLSVSLGAFGARMTLTPSGARPRIDYGLLTNAPTPSAVRVADDGDAVIITDTRHELRLEKETLAFSLRADGRLTHQSATDGHFVRRFRLPPFSKDKNGWTCHLDLKSSEPVYGLGEKWGPLDKRGQLLHSYNVDALGVNAEHSYKNTPFAWSPSGWGVFVHTPAPVIHGVGFAPWSQRSYGLRIEDDVLDLFLLTGSTGAEILRQYTDLTGRSPIPPHWSLGVILSKAYYETPEEMIDAAREVRARKMPCDTITIDGRAWQDTDTRFLFEWDKTRYPDPGAVTQQLKDMGFRICIWEYPLVSVRNPRYKEMDEKGWFLKDAATDKTWIYEWEAEPFGAVLTPLPPSGILDFTHPDAYAWWRDQHKDLFDLGIDMIKVDFGEQVLDGMIAHNGEEGRQLHNVYAFLYNRCVYEAAEMYNKAGPFLFSRAAWIGSQRFPSQWGGDPQADWGGLAASMRGGLSWGMTGAPFYATDIGGFYGDTRDPLLYVRWTQAAVFSAHMRLHGIGPREPWSYGAEAEAAAMTALKLRYRLLPYLHRTMKEASETGLPVQRAMALACPDEPEAWSFEDQFFFGEDLLVAPCLTPDHRVSVYLPEGEWTRFDLTSDARARFAGGRTHRVTLALDEVAVFARVGARIPLGPDAETTDHLENPPDLAENWIEYWEA